MSKTALASIVVFLLVGISGRVSAQDYTPHYNGDSGLAQQYNQQNEMRQEQQRQQQMQRDQLEQQQRAQQQQQQQPQLNNFQLQLQRDGYPQPIFK